MARAPSLFGRTLLSTHHTTATAAKIKMLDKDNNTNALLFSVHQRLDNDTNTNHGPPSISRSQSEPNRAEPATHIVDRLLELAFHRTATPTGHKSPSPSLNYRSSVANLPATDYRYLAKSLTQSRGTTRSALPSPQSSSSAAMKRVIIARHAGKKLHRMARSMSVPIRNDKFSNNELLNRTPIPNANTPCPSHPTTCFATPHVPLYIRARDRVARGRQQRLVLSQRYRRPLAAAEPRAGLRWWSNRWRINDSIVMRSVGRHVATCRAIGYFAGRCSRATARKPRAKPTRIQTTAAECAVNVTAISPF